jgi:hypothetical protein
MLCLSISMSISVIDSENWQTATRTQSLRVLPPRRVELLWADLPSMPYPSPLDFTSCGCRVMGIEGDADLKGEDLMQAGKGGGGGGGGGGAPAQGVLSYEPPPGTVLPVGLHVLTATFSPLVGGLLPASLSVRVEVVRGRPQLQWPSPPSLLEGQGLLPAALCCRCLDRELQHEGGSFTYQPPLGALLPPGTHSLRVHYSPPAHLRALFEDAEAEVLLLIRERTKVEPALDWPDPARLRPGSGVFEFPAPLDGDILCAKPAVDGTLTYDPPEGSLLEVGTHWLTATFAPRDTKNYRPVAARHAFRVIKGRPVIQWRVSIAEINFGTLSPSL